MKHPTPEEWMAFLYDEDEPVRHDALRTHAESCSECVDKLRAWRGSMQSLDEWPGRVENRRLNRQLSAVKIAAAVLILAVGFGIGRGLQRPTADLAAFRAELARDFDQRLAATAALSGAEVQRLLTEWV